MQSILLIGQSNMAGRGFLHQVTPICDERIWMLRNGRWQMMAEPIHFDRSVAGVGPSASFAQAWCAAHAGEQIGLIPCAEGGSSIDAWSPDGILFRHAVSEARYAMEQSTLIAALWHQGESDSYGGRYRQYAQKLDGIVRGLRQALGTSDLPFLIGGLGDYLGKSGFGLGCVEYAQINQAAMRYATQAENCYFVTGESLYPNPDGIHINAESQRRFGLRYFAAYQSRSHVTAPLPEEAQTVQALSARAHTPAEQQYLALEQFTRGEMSWEAVQAYLR